MKSLGNSKGDTNGFVLNFKQNQRYVGNYFVGLLHEDYPKWGRGDRGDFRFYPAGAKTREESQNLQPVKPKKNAVHSFSAGEIDPQPVHIILPDGVTDVPRPFMEAKHEKVPSLGAVFQKMFYSNQAVVEMLQAYAENHPERVQDMRDVYQQSDFTSDEKLDQVAKVVNTVLNSTKTRNGSNKEQ